MTTETDGAKVTVEEFTNRIRGEMAPLGSIFSYFAIGPIAEEDLKLFSFADDVESAFRLLETGLTKYYIEPDRDAPAIAKSRV